MNQKKERLRNFLTGFVVLIFSLNSKYSHAMSTSEQARVCHPGFCFVTQKAKDEYAEQYKCSFRNPKIKTDCSKKWRVSEGFIRLNEGPLKMTGYIPRYNKNIKDKNGRIIHKIGDIMGVSGVTISTGIDLGQQNKSGTKKIIENYIKSHGNPDNVNVMSLVKKLGPYFGKKRQYAADALARAPLNVTSQEALLLEGAFGFDVQMQVSRQFDRKNTIGMTFESLPQEAQTAIADFAYQYGLSDDRGFIRKKFWGYVYAGQWQSLADWFDTDPDQYNGRRESEADLLHNGIKNNSLPASGNPCAK